MKFTQAVLKIAEHDFRDTVSRPSFIITLLAMPLIVIVLGKLLIMRTEFFSSGNDRKTVGIVDHSGLLEHVTGKDIQFVASADDGRVLLDKRVIAGLFEIDRNYVHNGRVTVFYPPTSPLVRPSEAGMAQMETALRKALTTDRCTGVNQQIMESPLRGLIQGASNNKKRPGYLRAMILVMALMLMVAFSSNYLLNSVSLERENHMIEVLLVSVSPQDILLGKIIGLTSASLIHPALLLLFVGGLNALRITAFSQHIAVPALPLLFALLGLFFMACVMAGIGMIADAGKESQHFSLMWTIWMSLPFGILATIRDWNASVLASAISLFPLTSPVTVIIRLAFSEVPMPILILSSSILVGSTVTVFWVSTKLVRLSLFMRGAK